VFLFMFNNIRSMTGLAAAALGLMYCGWFPGHMVLLHGRDFGPGLVTMTIAIVAAADTGGYFAGKSMGRNKMTPVLSPNKTWEGTVGSFLAAAAVALAIFGLQSSGLLPVFPAWTIGGYLGVAVLLTAASIIGDLFESLLKRDAGVKDAGTLLPGHGGVLDRCDGFLFAGPVMFYVTGTTG